ncbi:hypothetical protein, partial [Ochrobactrum sp. SFR4]|uniref:hypothetical protein n=1 Tax=Ochrobactrum sp. SFR4 TaxID=2717368 RepID=UPI001C8C7A90
KPFHTFWNAPSLLSRILSKNRFTLFRMRHLCYRAFYPKTVSHFLECAIFVIAHFIQKPFHTFWNALYTQILLRL